MLRAHHQKLRREGRQRGKAKQQRHVMADLHRVAAEQRGKVRGQAKLHQADQRRQQQRQQQERQH